jgi:hypothetical protein
MISLRTGLTIFSGNEEPFDGRIVAIDGYLESSDLKTKLFD